MPQFNVELDDGRQFQIEADRQPSNEEAEGLVQQHLTESIVPSPGRFGMLNVKPPTQDDISKFNRFSPPLEIPAPEPSPVSFPTPTLSDLPETATQAEKNFAYESDRKARMQATGQWDKTGKFGRALLEPTPPDESTVGKIGRFIKAYGQSLPELVGKGMGMVSKGTGAAVGAAAGTGDTVEDVGQAVMAGQPLPVEQAAEKIPGWKGIAAKAGIGMAETIPKIGMLYAFPQSLLAQSIASAGIFGLDDKGNFSAKQAVIMGLMPGVGKLATAGVSRVLAKSINSGVMPAATGVAGEVSRKIIETLGHQAALDAYVVAADSPEIIAEWKEDPGKARKHIAEIAGQNLAWGLLGVGNFKRDVASHTADFISRNAEKYTKANEKIFGPLDEPNIVARRAAIDRLVNQNLAGSKGLPSPKTEVPDPFEAIVSHVFQQNERIPNAIDTQQQQGSESGQLPRVSTRQDVPPNQTQVRQGEGPSPDGSSGVVSAPGQVVVPPEVVPPTAPAETTDQINARKVRERVAAGIEPSHISISVTPAQTHESGRVIPAQIQIDERHPTLGNTFSVGPEVANESGLKVPPREELAKLPLGQYTLPDAIEKLKELGKAAAKEPWQMTRSEIEAEAEKRALSPRETLFGTRESNVRTTFEQLLAEKKITKKRFDKERWYYGSQKADVRAEKLAAKANHEYAVKKALENGEPIPPEVLAYYPDLKLPPPPEPPTGVKPNPDLPLWSELAANTREFNRNRTPKNRKKEIISRQRELRKQLLAKGYSPEQVKSVEMLKAEMPQQPEKPIAIPAAAAAWGSTIGTRTTSGQERGGFDTKQAKAQKKYLLTEIDKAIEEAPDIPSGEFKNEELKADHARTETAYDGQPTSYGKTTEEHTAEKSAWEEQQTAKFDDLFSKYGIPADAPSSTPYLNVLGETEVHQKGGPIDFSGRIGLLREAITKANHALLPKVTIDVPGDGTFEAENTKSALTKLREGAENFPTTAPKSKKPSTAREGQSNPAPLGEGGAEEISAILKDHVGDDATRKVLNYAFSDGKQTVATDGRRLVVVSKGSGGTEKKPVAITTEGKPVKEKDLKIPNWKQVIPHENDRKTFFRGLDTARLFMVLRQAKEATSEKSISVKIYKNPDGSLGAASSTPGETSYAHNIQEGAEVLGALDPQFLIDAVNAARRMGNEKVDILGKDELSPFIIKAKNVETVIMPVRLMGEAPEVTTRKASDVPESKTDERSVRDVWLEQYDRQLGKVDAGPSLTGMSGAVEVVRTAEMLGLDKGKVLKDLMARNMTQENADYALRNYKPKPEPPSELSPGGVKLSKSDERNQNAGSEFQRGESLVRSNVQGESSQGENQPRGPAGTPGFDNARPSPALDAAVAHIAKRVFSEYVGGVLPQTFRRVEPHLSEPGTRNAMGMGADTRKKIESVFGTTISFVDTGRIRYFNGATVEELPGHIFIDVRADKPYLVLAGHELLHTIQHSQPELFKELMQKITPFLKDIDVYQKQINRRRETDTQVPLDHDAVLAEMVGDFMGDSLADPKFWDRLSAKEPSLFRKLATSVLKFLSNAIEKLGGYGFITDIDKAHDIVADALAKFAKSRGEEPPSETQRPVTFSKAEPADEESRIRAHQVASQPQGELYESENIAAQQESIRRNFFDAKAPATTERDDTFWQLAHEMTGPNAGQNADVVFHTTRDDLGMSAEMAPALLSVELRNYALRAATERKDRSMLQYLVANDTRFATIAPGSNSGTQAAGRTLRAVQEFSKTPFWQQIQRITQDRIEAAGDQMGIGAERFHQLMDTVDALNLNPDELERLIREGKDKQGRTLEEIFGKPEGEPDELLKLITMLPLPDLPAELRIKSQKSLADRIMAQFPVSNLRDRFAKEGGDKLARQWWAILSGKSPEPEAKTVLAADQILQRELSGILKETLTKLGFEKVKGVQITDAEKLAMVLGKSELRGNKWERVDGQVRAAIEERRTTELASAGDDAELANIINEKYDQIKDAWDTASDSILNVPASDQMLRRMMHAELKGLNVDWNDLLQRGASTAELRRQAVGAALAKVQAAATNKLDLKATRSAMEGAFDQIEAKARNRYQMSQARRNEPTGQMANQRIAQGILNAFQLKHGAEVLIEPKQRNVVRQIIREFLSIDQPTWNPATGRWEGGMKAIAEATFTKQLADRLTAADIGVDRKTAIELAHETYVEALGRFADRGAKRLERAANATNLRGLIEDILRIPYRAQHDPAWRKDMAMQWFMSNGLSRDQARAATALFDKQFQTAYQAAGEKAARRFLGDHEEPKTVNEIVAAIRLGLTDPRKNWADDIAARSKFVPLTEAQQDRLSDLELKRADEALSPGERNAIEEQMMSIFRHTGTMDGQKMRRLGESFVASLLSGPRTATIQLEPLIMTMRDFLIIAARDPANAMQFFKAMKDSWKHIFASEFKYAWQKDAYGYHLQDIDRDHNALKTWWEKLDAEYKAAKNPGQKAWVRTRQIIASQQYVSRFLSSIDQAMMATAREWKLVYYASEAFKLAGIKDKRAISDLTDAVIMARQSAYNDAVDAGVPSDAAKVRANWMVEQVVKDFVSNRTDGGIASQVLKATENDMYSMVGRRGRAGLGKGTIAEMEEGFLSRPMNHFMEFMSKMRGHGGPDSIVSTAIFGFVNIPFRTARYWAQFSPYGLLRYGIHRYRLGQGKDTYWKQMFGTELQARARLREAVAGTVALGLASAWAAYNSTADDKAGTENFGLYITGQGPTNKVLRDAWQKQHWQQYALNFVIGGRKVAIPLTRVGEAILYPFIIAAAQDDAKWKVKELAATGKPDPNPISNLVSTLVGEYFSMTGQRGVLQGVTALSETARGGGGMLKMAANQAATVASGLLIPWKQLLAGISDMFVGPLDQSSISSLIASKFPIVGLPAQTRAVNRFGDPLYDRSWYGRIARTGVPIAFEVSKTPENEGLYPMLVDKGAAAPELRRYLLEEKYGPLTDAQFSKFAVISGAALKSQTNASLSDLQAMAPDEVKKFLTKAAHQADQEAVDELGLENVKPSKKEQRATSVGVASTPRGTLGADIGRVSSSTAGSSSAATPAPRASASPGIPRVPSAGYRGRLTAPGSRSSGGRLSLRASSSSASRSRRLVSGRLRVRSGGTRRRLSYRSPGRHRSRLRIHA